jgi:AcrR family transcriptional regulator
MRDTRRKLIDTAFELFGRNGFHAIGLDAILDAVGVSKQTFYNHFECKEDLILAVLRHRHETESAVFVRLAKETAGDDPRDQLYALFDVLGAWFNQPDWRGCIFVTAAAEFPLRTEPAHRLAAEHFASTRAWIETLASQAGAAKPAFVADQLTVLLEGTVAAHHVTGDARYLAVARAMSIDILDAHFQAVPTLTRAVAAQSSVA